MNNILIALACGIAAGAIDIIPMVRQKVNKFSTAAIFFQWVFIGLVIPFITCNIPAWSKGALFGVVGMTPFMIQMYMRNKQTIPRMFISAVALGMALAVAEAHFIGF